MSSAAVFQFPLNAKVLVHDNVAHSLCFGPRNRGVAITEVTGQSRSRFADDRQLVSYGALPQSVGQESRPANSLNEFENLVC
jgi:hypothetical protein